MSPEDAAALLGVGLDASAADIESAYRRRSRSTHPDRFVGASKTRSQQAAREFIGVAEARTVMMARRETAAVGETVFDEPAMQFPVETSLPRPRSRLLLVTWAAVALVAIFISIYGGAPPWSLWEPALRYGLVFVALIAFAVTGRTPWLVIALVALAATAIITVTATTLGALLGLFLMVAPVYGLVTIGRDVAVRRARWAQA
jgi:DnaJ domain